LVDICEYELPTYLQNVTQKGLTEVKIFQKVSGGLLFLKHPVVLVSYLLISLPSEGQCLNLYQRTKFRQHISIHG